MKVASRLCSALILLGFTGLVCAAEQGSTNKWLRMQDEYERTLRDMPRLSITNPIDVLRQQALIETYRRQIQQRERQIADNRAILNQIGKREVPRAAMTRDNGYQNFRQPPPQLDYIAALPIFEFLQRAAYNTLENEERSPNTHGNQDRLYGMVSSIEEQNNHVETNSGGIRNVNTDTNNIRGDGEANDGSNLDSSRLHSRYEH